jgi:hypothetical protein
LAELVFIELQVEKAKYAKGVEWLQNILFNIDFTPERVSVTRKSVSVAQGSSRNELQHVTNSTLSM